MDVSNTSNASTAISAYTTQQQVGRARQPASSDTQPANPIPVSDATKKAKGEQVSFTSEALRLSAQTNQASQASNAVNQANTAQTTNQYPLQNSSQQQAYQVSGAQSISQAISTYTNTFKI